MAETALEHRRGGAGRAARRDPRDRVLLAGLEAGAARAGGAPRMLVAQPARLRLCAPGGRRAHGAALVDAVEEAMDAAGWDTRPHGRQLHGWLDRRRAGGARAGADGGRDLAGGAVDRKEIDYSRGMLRSSYAAAQRLAPHAERITATAAGRRMAFGMTYSRPERLDPATPPTRSEGVRRLTELPGDDGLDRGAARRCRAACTRSTARPGHLGHAATCCCRPRQAPRWAKHVTRRGAGAPAGPGSRADGRRSRARRRRRSSRSRRRSARASLRQPRAERRTRPPACAGAPA